MGFATRRLDRNRFIAASLLATALALPSPAAAQSEADAAESNEESSEGNGEEAGTRSQDYSSRGDRSWAGQAIRGSAPRYDETNDKFVYPTGTEVRGTDPSGERGTVDEKGDIVYSDGTRVVHDPVTGDVTYVHPDGSSTPAGAVTYNTSRNVFSFSDGTLISGTDHSGIGDEPGQRAKVNEKGDLLGADGSIIVHDSERGETTYVDENGNVRVRDRDGNSTRSGTTRYHADSDTFIFPDGTEVRGTDPSGRRGSVNEKGDVVYSDGTMVTRTGKGGVNVIAPDGSVQHRGRASGHNQGPATQIDVATGVRYRFSARDSRQETGESKYNTDTGRYDNPDGSSSDTPNGSSGDGGSSSTASHGSGGSTGKTGSSERESGRQANSNGGGSKDDADSKDSKSESSTAQKDKDEKDKDEKEKSKSDGGSKGYTPMMGMDSGGQRPMTSRRLDKICNQAGRFSTRCPGAASQPSDQKTTAAAPVLGVQTRGAGIPQLGSQAQTKTLAARKGWTIDPGDQVNSPPSTRGGKPSDKQGWTIDPGEQSAPRRQVSEEELEQKLEERRNWAKGGREGF